MSREAGARATPICEQLADYLERTVYFVKDGKSFIYKFNTRNQVYRAIEPWIDEMVRGFFDGGAES